MKPLSLALALSAALAAVLAAASPASAQMREYPVRTPVPSNAVELSAGVRPPAGMVALQDNMPGHRRFKPPLFPDAGWDSPMRADGKKDYDRYVIDYWRAPYLPANHINPAHQGQEERGYVAPGPWPAQIARSAASAAEDALMERRMQFIVQQVLASLPLRDLHGASIEPELTVTGYGQANGGRGDGVMRGEIKLKLNTIMPNTGANERMPGGGIKSTSGGPIITITLNPDFINCAGPAEQSATGARCLQTDGRIWLNTPRPALTPQAGPGNEARLLINPRAYADGRPATDLRTVFVRHDRTIRARGELPRGRMHPHDPMGRVIGAFHVIDWNDVLTRAAAIQ